MAGFEFAGSGWLRKRFLTQRRKDAKRCRVSKDFICDFATLREQHSFHTVGLERAPSAVADDYVKDFSRKGAKTQSAVAFLRIFFATLRLCVRNILPIPWGLERAPSAVADDYAKDFSRKDAERCRVSKDFLCDFAPLREKHSSHTVISKAAGI
jgi:hypothetical protein